MIAIPVRSAAIARPIPIPTIPVATIAVVAASVMPVGIWPFRIWPFRTLPVRPRTAPVPILAIAALRGAATVIAGTATVARTARGSGLRATVLRLRRLGRALRRLSLGRLPGLRRPFPPALLGRMSLARGARRPVGRSLGGLPLMGLGLRLARLRLLGGVIHGAAVLDRLILGERLCSRPGHQQGGKTEQFGFHRLFRAAERGRMRCPRDLCAKRRLNPT